MKRIVIKNVICVFFTLVLFAAFFLLYRNQLNDISIFSKMLPFYMMSLALGVFSLSWSIRETDKLNFKNMIAIYLTLLLTILFIIVESVNVTIWCKLSFYKISKIISYILFGLSILFLLFDFGYAIYIDVNYLKNKRNN